MWWKRSRANPVEWRNQRVLDPLFFLVEFEPKSSSTPRQQRHHQIRRPRLASQPAYDSGQVVAVDLHGFGKRPMDDIVHDALDHFADYPLDRTGGSTINSEAPGGRIDPGTDSG